jgi:membrane-bound lytic murein transglycosylase D
MTSRREARIVNGLLCICIAAGFLCFALIVLPDELKRANVQTEALSFHPKNISDIVSIKGDDAQKAAVPLSGNVVRFDPEPQSTATPFDDGAAGSNPSSPPPDDGTDDVAGGAGAAIDEKSFESKQAQAGQGMTDGGNAEGELLAMSKERPSGERQEEITVIQHRPGSLSIAAPSALDSDRAKSGKSWIFTPEPLEVEVAFWRDIYAKYDADQVVLHHPKYLDIIYEVVDLSDISNDKRLSAVEKEYKKEKRVEERKEYVKDILLKLSHDPQATSLTADEWRIKKLFTNIDEKDVFEKAALDYGVRAQTGQRDKFIAGLKYSGRYLGEIEAIFEDYGMPRELTRLIFVESMFNPRAISSAGASGVWQFMPGTGKLYLKINDIVDERNDPILSTHASARLLRRNFDELGTWPLALNAYNAGRGRLRQAADSLGTRDISYIIKNFEHPAYGFASRNFFPEFLAALEIAEHPDKYFGPIDFDEPLKYEVVRCNYHISLPDVARVAHIPIEDIEELNPSLTPAVMSGKYLIPKGFALRMSTGRGELFLMASARTQSSRTGAIHYVVRGQESIASIAAMYGVDVESIKKANSGIRYHPRRGQKVIIPFD